MRALFAAQTFSLIATQVSRVILPTLAVLLVGASTREVAILTVVEYLPGVLLAPAVGAMADRLPARMVLIGADVVRALAIAAGGAYLLWAESARMLILIGLAAIVGAVSSFFDVTAATVVPRTIPHSAPSERASATSAIAGVQYLALIVGPSLGGLVAQLIRTGGSLLISAALYVGSLSFLPGVRARPAGGMAAGHPGASLAVTLRDRTLRRFIAGAGLLNLGGSAIGAIFVPYLYRDLSFTPLLTGIAYAANGAALLVGLRLARHLLGRWPEIRMIRLAATGCALAIMSIPFAPRGVGGVVVIMIYQLVFGVSASTWSLAIALTIQRVIPEERLGRANAVLRAVSTGAMPVGAAAASGVAGILSTRLTIAVFVMVVMLAPLVYLGRNWTLDSGDPRAETRSEEFPSNQEQP